MDCTSAFYEPGRGQLYTDPYTRTTDFLPQHITTVARTEPLLLTKISDRDRNVEVTIIFVWFE